MQDVAQAQASGPSARRASLRVLMLTDYFPKPTIPEMGVWALEQARSLKEAGAEVLVVSPTSWIPPLLRSKPAAKRFSDCPPGHDWDEIEARYPRWLFYSNERVRRLWFNHPAMACRIGWWSIKGTLEKIVREWKPDVIFAHHTVPGGMLALRLKERFGIPYIVQDHDFGAIESCASAPKRLRAYQHVARGAGAMAGVTDRMAQALARLIPGVNAITLRNGTRHLPAELMSRPRAAELADRVVVFSASLFYERKLVPLLIQAFTKVAPRHPQAVLRLAGDGTERPAVNAALAQANLGDRIQLLGMLDHDRVLQEMALCDLFMLIGENEPFATVYLEAMSAGKPIICCNDGGICELLQDGVQGRAVPPRNVDAAATALDQLLADRESRQRMGQAGLELFEKELTLEGMGTRTLELLQDAVKSMKS